MGSQDDDHEEIELTQEEEECNEVMRVVAPVAQAMVEEWGSFYPFGAFLTEAGDIKGVTSDGREHCSPDGLFKAVRQASWDGSKCPPEEMADLLSELLRARAGKEEIRATVIVSNVTCVESGSTEKTLAIRFTMDHRNGYSVEAFFPYTLGTSKKITFGEVFGLGGTHKIFGKEQSPPSRMGAVDSE